MITHPCLCNCDRIPIWAGSVFGGGQQLSVWVGSWNMGAAPPQYDQLHTWIEGAKGAARSRHDLYVVATQESRPPPWRGS